MSSHIDMSNNRANMAFLGNRGDIWHRLGQQMAPGMSMQEWSHAAGFNWHARKVPAIASLRGEDFDHIDPKLRFCEVPDRYFVARDDTGGILSPGTVSDIYRPHQPSVLMDWFFRYIGVDERWVFDVAGSLRGGQIIWATAKFDGDHTIAGARHTRRLLMSTTFDGTGATICKPTDIRVVCNNTFDIAMMDKSCEVRTRHNTHFDAKRTTQELAQICQGFERWKAIGDSLATVVMTGEETSNYFKAVLDIPFDAPQKDVSTRKLNQFEALRRSYGETVNEGSERLRAWTAFNAVTRFVDHVRPSSDGTVEKAALSTQFGSGASLKGDALKMLMPLIKDKVPVLA